MEMCPIALKSSSFQFQYTKHAIQKVQIERIKCDCWLQTDKIDSHSDFYFISLFRYFSCLHLLLVRFFILLNTLYIYYTIEPKTTISLEKKEITITV